MPDSVPDALLLITGTCPHCAATAEAALRLVKEGRLGRLEVVNLDVRPERGAQLGARSVPWLRLGAFELTGGQSYKNLADWAARAAAGGGWTEYVVDLLTHRELERAVALVREHPDRLADLLALLADDELDLGLRIGISALVEELAGSATLRALVPQLEQLTLSARPQTRADACHFLGLAGDAAAGPTVRRLLDDEDAEVREIAGETLAVLDIPAEEAVAGHPRPPGVGR